MKKLILGCKKHPRKNYSVPVAGCLTCAIAAEENKHSDSVKGASWKKKP